MFVILVYDAAPKRGAKLLKYLRRYLHWVQNSVFEGELTESQFDSIITGAKAIMIEKEDSLIYYRFDSEKYYKRGIIGIEKNTTDTFI